jgi:hypothetical protein
MCCNVNICYRHAISYDNSTGTSNGLAWVAITTLCAPSLMLRYESDVNFADTKARLRTTTLDRRCVAS